jgi:putative transposase
VTAEGRLFLAVILDLFSRYVVGWALSTLQRPLPDDEGARDGHQAPLPGGWPAPPLRPRQHVRQRDYQKVLAVHGITCSMSRRGNVHDNAAMESWNSTFKFECGERFETHASAHDKVFDYIEGFYNPRRRHSANG